MEFMLDWEDANKFVKFAKAFIDSNSVRPICRVAQCVITDGKIEISMCDGNRAAILLLPIKGESECEEDKVFFITPPKSLFKKQDIFVKVTLESNSISYTTAAQEVKAFIPKEYSTLDKVDFHRFFPEKENHIMYMNAKLLSESLKPFDGIVRLDCRDKLGGIVIEGNRGKAIVLPCRRPPKEDNR